MIKVIFDTDPGVDDAMALAFLRACADIDIVAITAVFGNATVDITARNAALLKERFAIDAPVYAGAADPLVIERLKIIGAESVGTTPDEMVIYMASQLRKWTPLVKASGIVVE